MLTKREWVERLEAQCAAAESCEYWRMRGDAVQVGREVHRVGCEWGETYLVWHPVPFLSSFLLRRRAEQRAAEADGVPF